MQLHEPQQMVLQHTLVAFNIHCEILGQKVEATTATSARKAVPNRDTVRVHDCLDSVASVEPAAVLQLPHPDPAALMHWKVNSSENITFDQSSVVKCR
jgi:hypothetical protein